MLFSLWEMGGKEIVQNFLFLLFGFFLNRVLLGNHGFVPKMYLLLYLNQEVMSFSFVCFRPFFLERVRVTIQFSFDSNLRDDVGMILGSDWSLWVKFDGGHCRILLNWKIILVLQAFGERCVSFFCTERSYVVCMIPVP